MQTHVILSLICDDRPGIVETLADLISQHGGNWLESSLSQLAGKFAGVIKISVSQNDLTELKHALSKLEQRGIRVTVEEASNAANNISVQKATIHAAGPDRLGIVKELAQALAAYGINVEKFTSECSSMPYSGEPIFEAVGLISMPEHINFDALQEDIDRISDSLAMDISISVDE